MGWLMENNLTSYYTYCVVKFLKSRLNNNSILLAVILSLGSSFIFEFILSITHCDFTCTGFDCVYEDCHYDLSLFNVKDVNFFRTVYRAISFYLTFLLGVYIFRTSKFLITRIFRYFYKSRKENRNKI